MGALQNQDFSVIHYAARRGEVAVLSRLLNWRTEAVGLLSRVNRNGHTPLHLAVMYNHADLAAYLIKQVCAYINKPCFWPKGYPWGL